MSTAKASGMWQFIPSTGRDFALKQNVFRDDRRDVLASTRAALDYLGRLYAMLIKPRSFARSAAAGSTWVSSAGAAAQ